MTPVPYIDVAAAVGDRPVDLLKCDIEGSEEDFLTSYPDLLRRVRTAVIEHHLGLNDQAACVNALRSAGLQEVTVLSEDEETTLALYERTQVLPQ